jgi:hypothetical protein
MSVNYHDQELNFHYLTETRKQNPIGEAEESDEPKERTVSLSRLIGGLGLIGAVVQLLGDFDLKKQR